MADMNIIIEGGGSNNFGVGSEMIIDPTFSAPRVSIRPLEYTQSGGTVLGHYRAVGLSGAVNTISAAGILNSLRWADSSRLFVLLRLSAQAWVASAITATATIDLQAFIFRGSTSNASGSGSSTVTFTGNNQKCRFNMGTSLFASNGEIRTIGTTTALTAAGGKTNDSVPFGAGGFNTFYSSNGTGTAAIVSAGVAGTPLDLYKCDLSMGQHPIILAPNEGIEIQCLTATPTTGSIRYAFTYDWAEVSAY